MVNKKIRLALLLIGSIYQHIILQTATRFTCLFLLEIKAATHTSELVGN